MVEASIHKDSPSGIKPLLTLTETGKKELVKKAKNKEELILALYKIGDIKGSEGTIHTPKKMESRINKFFEQYGGHAMDPGIIKALGMDRSLTRTYGIRDKVMELLAKEPSESVHSPS